MTAVAVFRAAWAFLRSPLGQVLALALLALLALFWADARGYARGVKAERSGWEARLAASERKAREAEAKYAEAAQRAGKAVATRHAEIRSRTEYLTREVVRYVPFDPGRPSVPVGLVRLHDAAALGLPVAPDTAGRADGDPSGIGDAALAETVVGNYGACHLALEQVRGWQMWAREAGLVR